MVDIPINRDEEKVQTTNPKWAMKIVVVCITLRFRVRVPVPQPKKFIYNQEISYDTAG